jgi:putative ABC transport system ATP-binding protein
MTNEKEEILIELKRVSKFYEMGEEIVKALDCVDIVVKKGDFVAIMGPSGSGKSTGMNLTGSLDLPTNGEVYLGKEDIANLEESELAQLRGKKIGFIFQQFNLIPNLTAKENVILPMIFQELNEEEREEKAKELLKIVDLEDRMEHYPSQLSGGQQQRVAIARAIANDPEVILADEPTGNLDSKSKIKIMNFLKKFNDEGKTVILVTHEPELAEEYAKTIYWLKDGKVEKITKKIKNRWLTLPKQECSN